MLLIIDNYDSFTYNLVHFFGELGASIEVHRNDKITVEEVIEKAPRAVVLSPGPCDPSQAGICLEMIARAAQEKLPLFGVCLGLQAIGQAFGATVTRAEAVRHGKTSEMIHQGKSVFEGLPNPFTATRYHSLVVAKDGLPDCLDVTAETDDGIIMGLAHKTLPIHGVQFHPESIRTEHGHQLLANFLKRAGFNVAMPASLAA